MHGASNWKRLHAFNVHILLFAGHASFNSTSAADAGAIAAVEQVQLWARARSPRGFIVFSSHVFFFVVFTLVVYAVLVAINKEMKYCLLFAKQKSIHTHSARVRVQILISMHWSAIKSRGFTTANRNRNASDTLPIFFFDSIPNSVGTKPHNRCHGGELWNAEKRFMMNKINGSRYALMKYSINGNGAIALTIITSRMPNYLRSSIVVWVLRFWLPSPISQSMGDPPFSLACIVVGQSPFV